MKSKLESFTDDEIKDEFYNRELGNISDYDDCDLEKEYISRGLTPSPQLSDHDDEEIIKYLETFNNDIFNEHAIRELFSDYLSMSRDTFDKYLIKFFLNTIGESV